MGLGDIFRIKGFKEQIAKLTADNLALQSDNQKLSDEIVHLTQQLNELDGLDYIKLKEKSEALGKLCDERKRLLENDFEELRAKRVDELKDRIIELQNQEELQRSILKESSSNISQQNAELEKLIKQVKTQTNKLSRSKELVKAVNYALDSYFLYEPSQGSFKITPEQIMTLDDLSPSIILKLHCMDVKDLRKAYNENNKQITKVLEKYSARYTTKANQAIYKLMVIALKAELQNILYNLKYEKLNTSVEDIKNVTQKYLKIAGEGNQSIVGTLTKFIGEIEYLFINAVKIEYNYYVKKEQARQEQLAIREQMRQEAEERKALENERKKIEQEESKYNSEIDKLREQMAAANEDEVNKLNARILELQAQLANVIIKKEEISNLANGKAGNVYIISNLGSFGDNVFKIGMTRRLNPQERVNELGDASVPFKFDVHSFIFSDDAVDLEKKLHNILNNKRVNKVNMRKEFFYTTIDELEALVNKIEPTAEFNKTMLAEEFRQSLSSEENYSNTFTLDDEI